MRIGVPKEIKNSEQRVGLTPAGVVSLTQNNHEVYVEKYAGVGSGFSDSDYEEAGAKIVPTAFDVYHSADLIIKVKEPLESEYSLIQKGQILFTYFHFASSETLTDAMLASGATCIAYETIRDRQGRLPLLIPMSRIAGRLSAQMVAQYLLAPNGGKGKLMGGIAGAMPAQVMVLGGGIVGTEAARVASGMGADVFLLDIDQHRLAQLDYELPANVRTLFSNQKTIDELIPRMDAVIGAVLIPGGKAPKLIRKSHLGAMENNAVLVDVAVDQGGCIETIRPTTHADPIYEVDGVTHYGVANMPGSVPRTSTTALTNVTLPYLMKIVNNGWKAFANQDQGFALGVSIANGKLYDKEVGEVFGIPTNNLI